jgi:hypothetical protein
LGRASANGRSSGGRAPRRASCADRRVAGAAAREAGGRSKHCFHVPAPWPAPVLLAAFRTDLGTLSVRQQGGEGGRRAAPLGVAALRAAHGRGDDEGVAIRGALRERGGPQRGRSDAQAEPRGACVTYSDVSVTHYVIAHCARSATLTSTPHGATFPFD